MMRKSLYTTVALLMFAASSASFATTAPASSEPAVEARLHVLSGELRCLVCQNESLASSRAPLAEDLRREVREQIRSGKNDDEIISYLTDRYGDFVTYRPPWQGRTLLLWLGPLLLFALAVLLFARNLRHRREASPVPVVDAAELARLKQEFDENKP